MDPHDLYGLPLEQFTDRRNELARELRRDGQPDEAAAVSKLRKPSVAAWAVNQLVRTQRRELDELFAAGDALQQTQADLLSKKGDATALRRAVERERAAVSNLADRARGLLNSDGHELTAARLEQVTETLHAAALDAGARTSVRNGRLERELRHVGLGALGATAAAATAAATAGEAAPTGRARRRRKRAQDDRSAELRAARRAEQQARRQLDCAVHDLETAARRRDCAAEELRDAEDALEAARRSAAEAEREHKRATSRLDRA